MSVKEGVNDDEEDDDKEDCEGIKALKIAALMAFSLSCSKSSKRTF